MSKQIALALSMSPAASLKDRAVEEVREAILAGLFPPGTQLNPDQMASELGISRGTVRAVLASLEEEGLVRTVPFRGTYVTEIDRRMVEDLYGVRSALEGYGARLAAERSTPEDVRRLDALLAEMQQVAAAGDVAQLVRQELAFHRSLLELSGNALLLRTWLTIQSQVRRILTFRHHGYPYLVDLADSHVDLVEHLRRGDADAASAAIVAHIEQARADLLARWPADS